MNRETLTQLYDEAYAASYEQKFLKSSDFLPDVEHELALIRDFLANGGSWLDVACGTGFFLRQFPETERAGIDISPAMLKKAREGNPDIPLILHDFRDPLREWNNRWDLVSCMWYAYGLVSTVDDLSRLIENLWRWTSPGGNCFVPLADPRLISGVNLPYIAPTSYDGRVQVTGIIWSFTEDHGRKVHSHMLAPNIEFMVEQFQIFFERVAIVRYPSIQPEWPGRPALVASGKKVAAFPPYR